MSVELEEGADDEIDDGWSYDHLVGLGTIDGPRGDMYGDAGHTGSNLILPV